MDRTSCSSALTLICNSVTLLGFQSLPKHIAYRQIFLPTLIFLSTITKANKTQKGQKPVAFCSRTVTLCSLQRLNEPNNPHPPHTNPVEKLYTLQ